MLKNLKITQLTRHFSVADAYSLSRALLLLPILHYIDTNKVISLCLYGIALWTDYLDGWIAKKLSLSSDFGQYLDPMADIVLHVNLLIVFYQMNMIPIWFLALFMLRVITLIILSYKKMRHKTSIKSQTLRSSILGKSSFFVIALLIFSLLAFNNKDIHTLMTYISSSVLVLSLIDYYSQMESNINKINRNHDSPFKAINHPGFVKKP